MIKALRPPTKCLALLSSYGWGGGAIRQLQEILERFKIEVAGVIDINGPPTEEQTDKIVDLAKLLASKIKENP